MHIIIIVIIRLDCAIILTVNNFIIMKSINIFMQNIFPENFSFLIWILK